MPNKLYITQPHPHFHSSNTGPAMKLFSRNAQQTLQFTPPQHAHPILGSQLSYFPEMPHNIYSSHPHPHPSNTGPAMKLFSRNAQQTLEFTPPPQQYWARN